MTDQPPPGLLATHLRAAKPDFLDLPWDRPFDDWPGHCDRLEELPMGEARHPVLFVTYEGRAYALKALPPGRAEFEYQLLRQMESLRLPVVQAVGHVDVRTPEGPGSVLVTRYLEYALPYHSLFLRSDLGRYRQHLLDAMAGLLVQLHLAGVFWGDCSLFNTLFLRDAGTLQACLVDAETSEVRESLSDAMREHDLDIMEENVGGALADLVAMGALADDYPALEVAERVRQRYDGLWREVSREVLLQPDERYRIEERVRALNALGFSVGEIEIQPTPGGDRLRLRVLVADRSFHRDLLHALTGLEAQEQQARQMVNEIQQLRASLMEQRNQSMPLVAAAYQWLRERFEPTVRRLRAGGITEPEPAELYCQLLEHKWYLSEQAKQDVGHEAAAEDFLERFGAGSGA